mmetsp:Transcript_64597/g.148542  ORF Transcript_64597/g.148542 Transcript_64597/m.148542 type:complete len:344 (-) Transcript_64597:116-1147(-)
MKRASSAKARKPTAKQPKPDSGGSSERFAELKLVGKGCASTVYRARDTREGSRIVALKVLKHAGEDGLHMATLREVYLLRALQGSLHIVELLGTHLSSDPRSGQANALVLTYFDQDLRAFLRGRQQVSMNSGGQIMTQLLKALAWCHNNFILHRDVKPDNVLVDAASGRVALCDFSHSRLVEPCPLEVQPLTAGVGSMWYRSPEMMLRSGSYTAAIDIWSAGCVVAEVFMGGKVLFPGQNDTDMLWRVFKMRGTPKTTDPEYSAIPNFRRQAWEPTSRVPWPDACDLGVANLPEMHSLLDVMLDVIPSRRTSAEHVRTMAQAVMAAGKAKTGGRSQPAAGKRK